MRSTRKLRMAPDLSSSAITYQCPCSLKMRTTRMVRCATSDRAGLKYSMRNSADSLSALRSSSRCGSSGKSMCIGASVASGAKRANFDTAVASTLRDGAPGSFWAARTMATTAYISALVNCKGREKNVGISATTQPSSMNTSMSASGVYGGTPHTAAICRSAMSSSSLIRNCLATSERRTRLRLMSHGNSTSSPATRSDALRGPRRLVARTGRAACFAGFFTGFFGVFFTAFFGVFFTGFLAVCFAVFLIVFFAITHAPQFRQASAPQVLARQAAR